ncbi:MAG: 5-dehydro-2-deoxygluconokinase [Acidimicrobiales bacterium]
MSLEGPIELLTIGRVSVDLYAEQINASVRAIKTFRKSIGGTSTNVAVAAARLGNHSAVCTRVGRDEFGDYVRWALAETFGVDTRFVGEDLDYKTPLAFAVLDPPDDATIIFYREPRAPDMNITMTDLDPEIVRSVPIFWMPASNVAYEPSRSTMLEALGLRDRRRHTVLDLDWRPMFWESTAEGTRHIAPLVDHVTLAIGNRTECEIAVGSSDPDTAADRLLARGLEGAIVKMGSDGVLVATSAGERVRISPVPIEVVNGLGAGDAFGGALCHGLLAGWDLVRSARFANAAGAIVASRLMCADDMPTLAEVEQLSGE